MTTAKHWIYFTNSDTDTVHLADFNAVVADGPTLVKTLCGRGIDVLDEGDESLSGCSATCRTCVGLAVPR
jgi:hypothetical protein